MISFFVISLNITFFLFLIYQYRKQKQWLFHIKVLFEEMKQAKEEYETRLLSVKITEETSKYTEYEHHYKDEHKRSKFKKKQVKKGKGDFDEE